MGHHPELWYEAVQYLVRMSREMVDSGDMNGGKNLGDQASELYRRATNILMKQNPLIHFAYANFESQFFTISFYVKDFYVRKRKNENVKTKTLM